MNFLWFGDMHETIDSPENRKDNFRETLNKKIEEIKEIGEAYNVTAYLQPGDFLHAPKYDYEFLGKLINRWSPLNVNKVRELVEKHKFNPEKLANELKITSPIIGVVGNHELYGNSLTSLHKTSINFLNTVGLIQFATKENPIYFTTDDGLKIAITGTHYHINMDKPEYINDYIVEEKLADYHIHIIHGYLTDKSFGTLFRHTTVDQIASKTKADLTISGHDHIGFAPLQIDGKWFVNPGSPVRLSNDLKEINRRPKVMLISITKEKGIELKNIYLKTAKNGEEVLDRSKIIKMKANENKMQVIKSTIQKASIKKGNNITEIISNIAENKNLPVQTKDSIIEEVVEAMKKMTLSSNNFSEYYISKILLENFQSHGNTVLECSPKLNVFVGDSRRGKTSVLRALSWVFENNVKKSRRRIKKGADFAKVSIYLSNGYVISRIVESKKSGKNGYEIYNPVNEETQYYNTKALPLVQEILAFTSLNIGTAKPIPLNFMKQGRGWFFIGDELTSTERAKVIGGIYGTHYADVVLKELEGKNKKINQQIQDKQIELTEVDKKIEKYNYLPTLKKDIESLEDMYSKLILLEDKRNKLRVIVEEKKAIFSKMNHLKDVLSKLNNLDEANNLLLKLKQQVDRNISLKRIISEREKIREKGVNQRITQNKLSLIDSALTQLGELKTLYSNKNDKESVLKEYNKIKTSVEVLDEKIYDLNKVISSTSYLPMAEEKLNNLKNLVTTRGNIQGKLKSYMEIDYKCRNIRDSIEKYMLLVNATTDMTDAGSKLEYLKKLIADKINKEDRLSKAIILNEKCKELYSVINFHKNSLSKTANIENCTIEISKVKDLLQRKMKVEEICSQRKSIHKKAIPYVNMVEKITQKNEVLINEYKDLLQQAGKCPVCLGTIDKATVNRIVDNYSFDKNNNK